MIEVVLKIRTQEALLKKWNQHIKHGVIFAPVHPPPKEGEDVTITLQPGFSSELVAIQGYVAQASVGISVIQLRGLAPAAREKLVALGIPEAAEARVGDETKVAVPSPAPDPAPPPPAAAAQTDPFLAPAEAEPERASVAETESETATATVATAVPAPQPAPEPPAPESAGEVAPEPAAPRAVPPKPAAFTPKAAAFKPGAAKFTPGGASFRPNPAPSAPRRTPSAPSAAGDPTDVRHVASVPGPASPGAEGLLPAPSATGTFGDETWRDVLLRLTTDRATGIVVIKAFREIRWAYMVDGGPIHFAGDTPHAGEFLSDQLIAEAGITMQEWTEALRMTKLLGGLPGELMVAQGRLSQAQLNTALTRRTERITRNLIGTNFGKWSFHEVPGVRQAFRNTPVNAVEVLMDSERKVQAARDNELIIRECEPFYKHHVKLVASRQHLLARIQLHDNERAVVDEMLGAGWTIGELVAYGGMIERPLLRLLSALQGMGLVEFVAEEGELSKRNRAERILWIGMRDLERRDAFEAVSAHWSSTPLEIEQGYHRVLAEYGMERFGGVADDRIKALITRIQEKANAIYRSLGDRAGRRAARKTRVGDDLLLMACELLDQQAQLALWKNDFPFVKACYERVLDLDPGVAEAGEARRNAKKAMADPRIANAQQPGEGRMKDLQKSFDAMTE